MRCLGVALAVLFLATTAAATDKQLTQQIAERLQAQKTAGNLRQFEIRLMVEGGAVFLNGNVPTAQQKRLVIEVARKTPGVRHIFSQLQIWPPLDESAARIAQTTPSKENSPDAPVPDSPASLLGRDVVRMTINDEESRPAANNNRDLGKPDSLQQFVHFSRVSLRSRPPGEARQITNEIIRRMRDAKQRGQLHQFGIDVQCEQQVVWLSGQVSSQEQLQLVLDLAKSVSQVQHVVHDLHVHHGATLPAGRQPASGLDAAERQLAARLMHRFRAEQALGRLQDFGIELQVDRDVVWIRGRVSSVQQQRLAVQIAERIPGVSQVVTELQVAGPE